MQHIVIVIYMFSFDYGITIAHILKKINQEVYYNGYQMSYWI